MERIVTTGFVVMGAVLTIPPWAADSVLTGLSALAGCVLLAAVGLFVCAMAWWSERLSHVRVTAGLTAAVACLAALPYLARQTGDGRPLIVAAMSVLVLFGSLPLRHQRIRAIALRVDPRSSVGLESVAVPLIVRARLSLVQHALALLFAWAISCLAIDGGPAARGIVAGAVYLLVLVVSARALAVAATDPASWRTRMRARDQAYEPESSEATLEAALGAARRRVFAREVIVASLLVGVATAAAIDAPTALAASVPVGVAAVYLTVVTLDLGRVFVASLRSPLAGGSPIADVTLNEGDGVGVLAADVFRKLTRPLGAVLVFVLILGRIADAQSIWQLLTEIYDSARSLL
jgi:hypothetical protein